MNADTLDALKDLVLSMVGLAIPTTMLVAIPVVLVASVVVLLAQPRWVAFAFVGVVMMFPESSDFGLVAGASPSLMYVYGQHTLFFSLFEYALFGAWVVCAIYGSLWRKDAVQEWPTLYWPLIGLAVLLAGHVLVGLADASHDSLRDLERRGFINVLKGGLLMSLLIATVRTQKDLKMLALVMLSCIAVREGYGLVRYLAFGGDPQNAYATLQRMAIKITFFDINDSILACFATGYCAWKLLAERVRGREFWIYAAFGLLAVATALLSARRTGQGGMLLGILALLLYLPKGRRWPILLLIGLALPVAFAKMELRSKGNDSVLQSILLDVKTSPYSSERESRFFELKTAWQTMQEHPVFGVGPSGTFEVLDARGLEYHGNSFDFVHSGIGHMMLKGGAVGVVLYLALYVIFVRRVLHYWPALPPDRKAMMAATITAMLGTMPNLFVGTPIVEIRSCLVIGILLVLPYLLTRDLQPVRRPSRADIRREIDTAQRKPDAGSRDLAMGG